MTSPSRGYVRLIPQRGAPLDYRSSAKAFYVPGKIALIVSSRGTVYAPTKLVVNNALRRRLQRKHNKLPGGPLFVMIYLDHRGRLLRKLGPYNVFVQATQLERVVARLSNLIRLEQEEMERGV